MKIKSPAKINLALDIESSPGEYHFVDTILQQIDLADELTFEIIGSPEIIKSSPSNKPEIIIECDDPDVPTDKSNTIHKAISLLKSAGPKPFHSADPQGPAPSIDSPGHQSTATPKGSHSLQGWTNSGIKVTIKKNIPVASGLGGGSSNAAVTLSALNKLLNLHHSPGELRRLAAKIGVDTPFFIDGGTAFGTHYGEEIAPLPPLTLPPHLIVIDEEKTSTKAMYAALDPSKTGRNKHQTKLLLEELAQLDEPPHITSQPNRYPPTPIKNNRYTPNTDYLFHNDFDQLLSTKNDSLKKKLLQLGANFVHICGSGPALYALFSSESKKQDAYKELEGQVRFIWQSKSK